MKNNHREKTLYLINDIFTIIKNISEPNVIPLTQKYTCGPFYLLSASQKKCEQRFVIKLK